MITFQSHIIWSLTMVSSTEKWVSCMYTHKPDAIKADFVMVALHLVEPVLVGIGVEEVRKCSVTWPHLE